MRRSFQHSPIALFLALACVVLAPGPARAGAANPDPRNTVVPTHITVVASGVAGPDSAGGHFQVRCLDLMCNPIANSSVVVDFSRCTDVALASDQQDPRLLVICQLHSVHALSDPAGIASFTILGTGTGGPPGAPGAVVVYVDGVRVGAPVSVAVLDRDGEGGLTTADLSKWSADFFAELHRPIADLDGDGEVTLADLSRWAERYFSGDDASSAGPWCP